MKQQPTVEQDGQTTLITFTDGQPRDQHNMLAKELEGHTENMLGRHLVLDCKDLSFIQSEEVDTLVLLHRLMRAQKGSMRIINVEPAVYEVFAACGLTGWLSVHRPEVPLVAAPNAQGPTQG